MEVMQDGVEIFCLPDGATCTIDESLRSPFAIEKCPIGQEACCGECLYYQEIPMSDYL